MITMRSKSLRYGVALVLASVGVLTLALSSAATFTTSLEAESGVAQGTAVKSDNLASGGKAITFGQSQSFGFSAHILKQDDEARYLSLAQTANAATLRDDFAWSDIERNKGVFDWGGPDEIMRLTAQRGIRVLAIGDYSPNWASSCPGTPDAPVCGPVNAADYANFVGKLAERYGSDGDFWKANPALPYTPLAGIEIWNEPNIKNFWQNPHGGRYALIVKAGYTAIKKADPSITVLAGSMAPAGDVPGEYVGPVTFLSQMYDAGAGGYFDALSHHPYNYSQGKTAEIIMGRYDWSAWSQMADTQYSLRSEMIEHGDTAKKIWVTEFGAPVSTDGISEAEQAKLATIAVARWKTYPWAGNFYWYSLSDDCTDIAERECRFGALRYDYSARPAYQALKDAYAR